MKGKRASRAAAAAAAAAAGVVVASCVYGYERQDEESEARHGTAAAPRPSEVKKTAQEQTRRLWKGKEKAKQQTLGFPLAFCFFSVVSLVSGFFGGGNIYKPFCPRSHVLPLVLKGGEGVLKEGRFTKHTHSFARLSLLVLSLSSLSRLVPFRLRVVAWSLLIIV